MADEQGNTNNVDRKIPKIELPESFDSWTVITGSMSKPSETESTTKSNENENKLNENDPEPSTSGVESLEKDEIDSPSENNLENTDELSDGISIIEEDSDSLGRRTPLNMFSNEDYHINYDIYHSAEKYNKSTLTNPNENVDIVDSRSENSLSFKKGISGFFIISVFFGVLAFVAKLKYPEWSETASISDRIIDLELQNNLLRAELDILSKELNYIRNKDHNKFHDKNHYKDKMDQEIKYKERNSNFHQKDNLEDKIDQNENDLRHKVHQGKGHEHKGDQNHEKKNQEDKIKVWPGGDDMQETEIEKEVFKKHYVNPKFVIKFTAVREEQKQEEKEERKPERRFINADYDGWSYPEYVDAILKYFDYNIDYDETDIFTIDPSTYDRLVKLLQSRNVEVPTKSQYQKFVNNYRREKNGCVTNDEFLERLDAEELEKKLKERRDSATKYQEHLRTLSMQELRDIFVNSPDPEVQVTAQLILREKIDETKYHYNVVIKNDKKKVAKELNQTKEKTESKDNIRSNKDTKEDKQYKDKNEHREQRESEEKSNDASKKREQYNKNSKGNKQFKDINESRGRYESQEKPNAASKDRVYHYKNSKETKQSKEKHESGGKDYHGSDDSIHKNKNENPRNENVNKKDWHEKLMRERENIRDDKRKKNWYAERGYAREQARATYK